MRYRRMPARRRASGQWVDGSYPIEDGIPYETFLRPTDLRVEGPEPDWIDTGLVTADGEPIVRPGREPIGYLRFEEPEVDI